MLRLLCRSHALKGIVFLTALLVPGLAHAQISLMPTISVNGGVYHYDYSVVNNTALDLSVITFSVLDLPDAVQNLTAPTGFQADFDPGLGLVDFLEDTDTFAAGTTVSGFTLDSPYAPNPSAFQALALDANGGLMTFDGTTLAPAAVPEPGALVVIGAALAPTLLFLRRLRRADKR